MIQRILSGLLLVAALSSQCLVLGQTTTKAPAASSCGPNQKSPYKALKNVKSYCEDPEICPGELCVSTLCSCASNSTTPTTSPVTTKPPSSQIPAGPTLIAYYDAKAATPPFESIPDYYKIILISFSVLTNGVPSDPIAEYKGLDELIKKRQAKGGLVYLSVGGAANCGKDDGSIDNMFGQSAAGNEAKFASGIADMVEKYGLDGVDVDYECKDVGADGKSRQNDQIALAYSKALRAKLPKLTLSWTAFSDINSAVPSDFADHVTTFKAITPYYDIFLWMAYNIGSFRGFYDGIQGEFDKIFAVSPSIKPSQVALGTCAGAGCAYGGTTGPLRSDAASYIKVGGKALGVMIWDIRNDYTAAGNNWDKTIGAEVAKAYSLK